MSFKEIVRAERWITELVWRRKIHASLEANSWTTKIVLLTITCVSKHEMILLDCRHSSTLVILFSSAEHHVRQSSRIDINYCFVLCRSKLREPARFRSFYSSLLLFRGVDMSCNQFFLLLTSACQNDRISHSALISCSRRIETRIGENSICSRALFGLVFRRAHFSTKSAESFSSRHFQVDQMRMFRLPTLRYLLLLYCLLHIASKFRRVDVESDLISRRRRLRPTSLAEVSTHWTATWSVGTAGSEWFTNVAGDDQSGSAANHWICKNHRKTSLSRSTLNREMSLGWKESSDCHQWMDRARMFIWRWRILSSLYFCINA